MIKNIIQRQAIKAIRTAKSQRIQSEFKAYPKRNHSESKANSVHKMSTFAMRIKEVIVNMPDNLDTKKEVDEYYKNAMKNIKEKNKEDKKEKKAEPKKRTKKVEVDDEGNEIVKVKRPLNKYQKFIQDNRKKVKEENPEMSGEEIFTLIAEMWGKHKEDIKNGVINDDDDKKDSDDGYHTGDDTIRPDDGNETDDSEDDDKKDSDDDKKEEKKTKKAIKEKEKKVKAPKKEKVDKKAK